MVCRLEARPLRILIAAMFCVAFLLASAAALRPWVAQWAGSEASVDGAARRALSIDPGNDRFQAMLATLYQYSLLIRDYPAALTAYQAALRANPLDSASWLHLGKLYQKLDRPREADRALRLAVQLAPSDAGLLWEGTLAYLEAGELPEALSTLSRFIAVAEDGDDRRKGYDLAGRLASPDEVLRGVIPSGVTSYTQYLTYLLDRNRGTEALQVWGWLNELTSRSKERIDPKLQLRVVDLLVAEGKFGAAHGPWTNLMKTMDPDAAASGSNLISNASFERRDTLGRGFDWKIGGAPGIVWDLDTSIVYAGRQSLRLSFGTSPAEFSNVSQVVPVQADSTYTLVAYIKTRGLEGASGVQLEVLDPLGGVLARTQPVAGTRDWTKVGATFRTAARSGTATIRIHRGPTPPSIQLDGATAWIDTVSLMKTD